MSQFHFLINEDIHVYNEIVVERSEIIMEQKWDKDRAKAPTIKNSIQ